MKPLKLSQSSFDGFLKILDPNRDRAGRKYEALRIRLVKFFEWRAYQYPDELADETLDRIIKKFAAGEQINDYLNYAYGIARLVYLEALKNQTREKASILEMPVVKSIAEDDSQMDCLEKCLKKLSENSRTLMLDYYRDDKQAKINLRKQIATKLGLSMNALRIRVLRIRNKIEECVFKCLEEGLI